MSFTKFLIFTPTIILLNPLNPHIASTYLLPTSAAKFNPELQFTKALSSSAHGVHSSMLSGAKLSSSETESFPFPYHTLLVHLFVLLQLFVEPCPSLDPSPPGVHVFTYRAFLSKLRDCLDKLGYVS